MGKAKRVLCLLALLSVWLLTPAVEAAEWGKLMAPPAKANIRAKRSIDSALKGQLQPGETVKADFLKDNWYAIFPVTEERRDESLARGYVLASLLRDPGPQPPPPPPPPAEAAKPSAPAPAAKLPTPAPAAPKPAEKPAEKKTPYVTVEEIAVRIDESGKERLAIRFDRFYIPFLSGVEGAKPQIVVEVPNTAELGRQWEVIEPQGVLIRKVRSHWDPKTRLVRIVLEMEPAKNHFVKPLYFEESNTYCLDISEEKEGKAGPSPPRIP